MTKSIDDGTWDASLFPAHALGVTSLTWAPAVGIGSLTEGGGGENGASQGIVQAKRFATGGCDGLVRVWGWKYVSSFSFISPYLFTLNKSY